MNQIMTTQVRPCFEWSALNVVREMECVEWIALNAEWWEWSALTAECLE